MMNIAPGAHAPHLSIDTTALVANWRLLAARATPAACAAVVKADAYGIGIEVAVPALAAAGCQVFFVAHAGEGLRVRALARDAVVYVLNGLPPGSAPALLAAGLRPVLGSAEEVAEWRSHGQGAPCALHVDTGMNRLGLPEATLLQLVAEASAHLGVALLMTHLVAAEEPCNPLNASQASRFARCRDVWEARFGKQPGAAAHSLLNSSGLFLPGLPRHDLARPGYALYGGNPVPGQPNPMRPVVRLSATILQVRQLRAGETVGYNGIWVAPAESRIATVSLGYADGWLRGQSRGNDAPGPHAMVRGHPCPLVGRVSMDLITLDVTALGDSVRRGDEAVFLGDGIGVDDVGGWAGTNGYEILTSLGRRHAREVL
jgi:alanine racemase